MTNTYKIHFTTYIFYLILILSGYINYLFYYLIIIIVHELGHIIMIHLLNLKIISLTIYPFGGIINTNINYNLNSNKLFLISIAGILFQTFLFFPLKNISNYDVFKTLNTSIIIFNLLPIIPSDGSKIFISFIERFISYKNTLILSNTISIISLIILFILSKNIFIFVILYFINAKTIRLFYYIINKFKLERYLYKHRYKKLVYVENENDLKKCRNNYIKYDNIYVEENKYFENKFGKTYWQNPEILVSSKLFVSIHYKPH